MSRKQRDMTPREAAKEANAIKSRKGDNYTPPKYKRKKN